MRLFDSIFKKKPIASGEFSDIVTEDDIISCFRLLLLRTPKPEEWVNHRLLAGKKVKDVVETYLRSPEFKTIHQNNASLNENIVNVVPPEFNEIATEEDIYYCFRLLLGRNPPPAEWAGHQALVGHCLRDVVSSYITSMEFQNRKTQIASVSGQLMIQFESFKMWILDTDAVVSAAIKRERCYEPHVAKALSSLLNPNSVFVDIGANIGYFSIYFAGNVKKI
jgi:hypothetical protein